MKKKIALGVLALLIVGGIMAYGTFKRMSQVNAVSSVSVFKDNVDESQLRVMVENILYHDLLVKSDVTFWYLERELETRKRIFAEIYKRFDDMDTLIQVLERNTSNNELLVLNKIREAKSEGFGADYVLDAEYGFDEQEDNYQFYIDYLSEFTRNEKLPPGVVTQLNYFDEKEMYKSRGDGSIMLTYDDGVGARTNELLDIYQKHGAVATFFIQGNSLEGEDGTLNTANIDTVKRMIDDGHEVAGHTFSHPNLNKLDSETLNYEIKYVQELVKSNLSYDLKYFRATYGARNEEVLEAIYRDYETNCNWDIDSQDWRNNFTSEIVLNRVVKLAHLENGGLVLMHDVHDKTIDLADELLTRLSANGFRFEVVADNK